jgi:choline/ethanolamine kinase
MSPNFIIFFMQSYSNVEITRISGAMTNLVYLAHNFEAPPATAKVIIRIFGRGSLLFSRHQERGIFLAASRLNIGPQCLVEFTNGRIEQFLPGVAVTALSMRHPEVAAAIATALSDFHVRMFTALPLIREEAGDQVQGASPRSNDTGLEDALWERLRGWLAAATEEAPEDVVELGLGGERAESEIEAMKEAAESDWGPSWLALTHNDLQYGNVLLGGFEEKEKEERSEQNGEENKEKQEENDAFAPADVFPSTTANVTATLIDYEYCTVGDIAFDIANHFCEYAADYHRPEEEMLDWERLPTTTEREFFCRAYIESLFNKHPTSLLAMNIRARCGTSPSKQRQKQEEHELISKEEENGLSSSFVSNFSTTATGVLVDRVRALMPLSHLKWGLWGIIQSKLSEVEFDYKEYARKRLQQYHATKCILLESEVTV